MAKGFIQVAKILACLRQHGKQFLSNLSAMGVKLGNKIFVQNLLQELLFSVEEALVMSTSIVIFLLKTLVLKRVI